MSYLKKVIESHCEDLEKYANILSEHKELKETVSEMRLAVAELKEAVVRSNTDYKERLRKLVDVLGDSSLLLMRVMARRKDDDEEDVKAFRKILKHHNELTVELAQYDVEEGLTNLPHKKFCRLNELEIYKLRDETVEKTTTFIPYHIFEIVAEATMDACGIPKET